MASSCWSQEMVCERGLSLVLRTGWGWMVRSAGGKAFQGGCSWRRGLCSRAKARGQCEKCHRCSAWLSICTTWGAFAGEQLLDPRSASCAHLSGGPGNTQTDRVYTPSDEDRGGSSWPTGSRWGVCPGHTAVSQDRLPGLVCGRHSLWGTLEVAGLDCWAAWYPWDMTQEGQMCGPGGRPQRGPAKAFPSRRLT